MAPKTRPELYVRIDLSSAQTSSLLRSRWSVVDPARCYFRKGFKCIDILIGLIGLKTIEEYVNTGKYF